MRMMGEERMDRGGSSWHTADGSSITVSPPSGGRSEELPSSPPALLLSPLSFPALGSSRLLCNEAGRGETPGGKGTEGELRFIIYWADAAAKDLH